MLAAALTHATLPWLGLGIAMHLINQLARGRGWWSVIAAAAGPGLRIRRRDAVAAWVAGAGVAGATTARAGDAVRVVLLRRRAPGPGAARLAGTLVAEAAGELAVGWGLIGGALLLGVMPSGAGSPPLVAGVAAGALLAAGLRRRGRAGAAGRRRPARHRLPARWRARIDRVLAGVGAGCAPLADPRRYARQVLPWQLASRACRIVALCCFLAAFHLPVTPRAVLVVIVAQGAGSMLAFSPAALAAGAALLVASFGPVTGAGVAPGTVAGFYVGTTAVLTAIGALGAGAVALAGSSAAARWAAVMPGTLRRWRLAERG